MTVIEAILSAVPVEVDENTLLKVLIDRHLSGDGNYTGNSRIVNLATADVLVLASRTADFSEGRLSVKSPRGKMSAEAIRLYITNGEPEKADQMNPFKAHDISNRW